MTDRSTRIERRTVIKGSGVLIGATSLAGCSGDGGGGGGDVVGDADKQRVDDYLSDTDNYGNIRDRTGASQVTIDVGAEGNGGNFAFGPAAIAVTTGTAISWEWTGEGGQHNVVATDSSDLDFRSGDPQDNDTFEQTFETTGVGLYFCDPHRGLGMKGAVVVVE